MATPPRSYQLRSRKCPNCAFPILDDGSFAGQVVACPQCNARLKMPAAKPHLRSIPVEDEFMPPPVQTTLAQPGRSQSRVESRHRPEVSAFKIGMAALAVSAVVLLAFIAGKTANEISPPVQSSVQAEVTLPVATTPAAASHQVGKPIVPDDLEKFIELELPAAAEEQLVPASTTDMNAEQVFAKAAPAVVLIEMRGEANKTICTGSGFFIDDQGTLVTNAHVALAPGALFAVVMLSDDRPYIVEEVYAADRDADIAVLKITGHKGEYIVLAEGFPNVGAKVYAIGNPLGLRHTITDGIVSQVRALDDAHAVIQTSAPISPGNSGGPLIDGRGKVVGVNTWAFAKGQNLNFAVGSTVVRHILQAREKSIRIAEAHSTKTSDGAQDGTTDATSTGEVYFLTPDASLAGLAGVSVMVQDLQPASRAAGLMESDIQRVVEYELRKAGVTVFPIGQGAGEERSPCLYVSVATIRDSTSTSYGYVVTCRFYQAMNFILPTGQDVTARSFAATWDGTMHYGSVGSNNLRLTVLQAFATATKEFATAFKAAQLEK